jgi:carbonic anhydrase
MTTQKPMDISPNKWDNYCDEKCAYSFKYKTSSTCTVKNYGSYLHLNYDPSVPPPVTFNANSYNVDNIEIYSPSLHLFNGNKADGELIITHMPVSIGKPLMVCIPLNSMNVNSSAATQIVTDIINGSTQLAANGDAINLKLNDYNLSSIVPQTPFYYYKNTDDENNIIVYGIKNSISINKSVIDTLQKIITPVTDIKYPTVELFEYNKFGPSMGGSGGDEIYIDCQPTGNSEETTEVEYSKSPTNNDLGSFFNSQVFIFIIAALIFVMLIVIIHKIMVYFSTSSPKSSLRGGASKYNF